MKGTTGVIIGVILAVVVILGVLNYQNLNRDSGVLYIGVTDATADINGVTDIDMSVSKVEVYNEESGWVTASSNSKTYSLLALKASGEVKLHAKAKVKSGSYDKVRVTLGDTTVRTKAQGDVKAVKPSSRVTIESTVDIKKGTNSYIHLDFLADKSLHVAKNGEYVFAPVVKTESRSNASVVVTGENIEATEGSVEPVTLVGVDLAGKSRINFELVTGSSLEVQSSSDNKVMFLLGGELYTPTDEEESGSDIKIPNSIESDGSLAPKTIIEIKDPAVNTESSGDIKLLQ